MTLKINTEKNYFGENQAALPPSVWQHNLHPFGRELFSLNQMNKIGLKSQC
jgi:hypothetical protein